MNPRHWKKTSVSVVLTALIWSLQTAHGQFYDFTRAIPPKDSSGTPLAGANTTFADGTAFQPDGDLARSSNWAWRPFGNVSILSSLGPSSSTPPTNTRELATTITSLKPGAQYTVKVLFWSSTSSLWGVRAGLSYAFGTRTNAWFDNTTVGVVAANLIPWKAVMPTNFSEGGRTLYAAPLGTGAAGANGQLKVFVHDLPTGDSNQRTWYQGVAVAEVTPPAPHVIECGSAGTSFHRGVRGLALADVTIDRGEYSVGIPKSLEVAPGSSIRGVATGIAAELYDWRVRNGQPRPPTLQFLRYSRDYQSELFLGANIRGLVQADTNGGFLYYDTQPSTLAALAADWVRYVNHIVPSYRQGDTINDSRDAAIVNSLTWSSAYPGDAFDTLLAPGEPAVPQVQYWEIGNEPTVGVTAYSVNNSYTLDPTAYHERYAAVAQAIKAENPGVKVGPTIIDGSREGAQLAAIVSDLALPMDFISYHPYEKMGLLTDPAQITLHLGSVYSHQLLIYNQTKKTVSDNGRDPDALEYAATEVNVSNWDTNDTDKEARQAHALGTVETIFTHARLGLVASMYWIWPTHRFYGTEYPVFKAYQKLRDHMGDTLLSVYAYGDTRLYTTRDSKTGELAVWGLNFADQTPATVQLQFRNLPTVQRATLLRLEDQSGTTTLSSANLAPDMVGGPTLQVDWNSSNLTGQSLTNFNLSLPAATLSLLVIEPGLDRITPSLIQQDGEKRFGVTLRPVPYASAARYRLLRSDDLAHWQTVAEVEAGVSESLTLTDSVPVSSAPSRFFRVEIVR
jgi:hypothetical protein